VHGDIILEAAGITLQAADDMTKIREKLNAMRTGQTIKIRVLRAGKIVDLTGTLP